MPSARTATPSVPSSNKSPRASRRAGVWIYGKLSADLAAAMMSINAVKGVEIGEGMAAAALTGTQNADLCGRQQRPALQSNHAAASSVAISNGDPVVVRFAVKPTCPS